MSFRVITSSYTDKELLSTWIPSLETNRIAFTIYHKVDSLERGEEKIINEHNICIPNYGRCDYAFLYHIVKNYDNLDDVTMFVKNNWGYESIDIWNHIQKSKNVDFIESGNHIKFQYWTDEHADYPRDEEIHKCFHIFAQTPIHWYNEIFPGIAPPNVIIGWGMGPCFSVSKKLIHRHPKEIYQHLLEKFYPESGSWNIEKANTIYINMKEQLEDVGKHYHDCFQRFWRVLFTHNVDPTKYLILQSDVL